MVGLPRDKPLTGVRKLFDVYNKLDELIGFESLYAIEVETVLKDENL